MSQTTIKWDLGRVYLAGFLLVNIALTLMFLLVDPSERAHVEKIIVDIMLIIAAIFYAIIVATVVIASRTRLNMALATQKFYWLLLIALAILPVRFWGPEWILPQWARVYIYIGIGLASPWVLYELCMANDWGTRLWQKCTRCPDVLYRVIPRRKSREI